MVNRYVRAEQSLTTKILGRFLDLSCFSGTDKINIINDKDKHGSQDIPMIILLL